MKPLWVAATGVLFCLRLQSCGPWFKSQAHHLHFLQIKMLKLKLYLMFTREKDKIKQKEAGIGPYLKKETFQLQQKNVHCVIASQKTEIEERKIKCLFAKYKFTSI